MKPPSASSAVPQLRGAHGERGRGTDGLQKSGVIWRGSSGRMLMESSARPHSRHSMVYSCSGTRPRGFQAALSLPDSSPPLGKPEPGPAPDPRLQSDRGGSCFIPRDPISPEPIFQHLAAEWEMRQGGGLGSANPALRQRRGEPKAPVSSSCPCRAPELPPRRSPPKLCSSLLRL